jgi:thioredoxin 1
MLSNVLKKLTSVKTASVKEDLNLQSLNWCEHEKTWVLFYFSTSWCAPCKTMAPLMDVISDHYSEHLKVVKIDVDEQIQLAKQLKVTGVPTLVLLNQSGHKSRLIGGVNTKSINRWLDEQLNQPSF